ncbi:GLPGLI family protein [Mucilaginibacter sp. SMC90]|uniref:GLPGLI family protein n=1 Tax=Mucilaginibacter sp. SMC90 TaxID=2929803 RepID=UPI001FB4DB48|nr:GLPGLI family protein [Mucilaginibacter sp. SMC90]UOE48629.1 GLPGLI family protein [Mucilaginibacter sp. SMC90]
MKKILTITTILLLSANLLLAQGNKHFTFHGTIEYDKSSNMWAMLQKLINKDNESWYQPMYDQYKKSKPQFKVLKSTLKFDNNQTLFTPIEPEYTPNNFGDELPMAIQNNTIYTDFNTGLSTSQKKVFEETFLVKDTTRHIKWKLTGESREIAGYTCRRANGLILDSIYVVAFYTDEIPVSGGPESFNGLPGMILGVALPHENITWFATKVTEQPIDEKSLAAPKKGKAGNTKSFLTVLQNAMKDWGETYAKQYLKGFSL